MQFDKTQQTIAYSDISGLKADVRNAFFKIVLNEQYIHAINESPPYYAQNKTQPFAFLENFLHKHICSNDARYKFRVYYKYDGVVSHEISKIILKQDDITIFTYYNSPKDFKYNLGDIDYDDAVEIVELCRVLTITIKKEHEYVIDYFKNSGFSIPIDSAVKLIIDGICVRNYFVLELDLSDNSYNSSNILESANDLYEKYLADFSECVSIECASILDKYMLKNIFVDVSILDTPFDFFTKYEDKDVPYIFYDVIRLTNSCGKEVSFSLNSDGINGKIDIYRSEFDVPTSAIINIGEYLFNVSRYAKNLFIAKGQIN